MSYNTYSYYRFNVKHGDNIAYNKNSIDDAIDDLDGLAKSKICVKEPFRSVPCKIVTHADSSNTYSNYRFHIMHGENVVYKVSDISEAVKLNKEMIDGGICFDGYEGDISSLLQGPISSSDWIGELVRPAGNAGVTRGISGREVKNLPTAVVPPKSSEDKNSVRTPLRAL